MGLDVYLYREESRKQIEEYEKKVESIKESVWNKKAGNRKYEDLKDAERKSIFDAQDKALKKAGLIDGIPETLQQIVEIPSKIHPEHYFKIGYFRSSYNDSGIDSVLDKAIGESLYTIFGVDDGYIITPDWEAAKKKAENVREKYLAYLRESKGYAVESIVLPMKMVASENEAMDLFKKSLGENGGTPFRSYSSAQGSYFLDGLKIHALFASKGTFRPEILAICKRPDDWNPESDYYIQALEIVIETIDWVLSQPDTEKYVFHWSG